MLVSLIRLLQVEDQNNSNLSSCESFNPGQHVDGLIRGEREDKKGKAVKRRRRRR